MRKTLSIVIIFLMVMILSGCTLSKKIAEPVKEAKVEVVFDSVKRVPNPINADTLIGEVKNIGNVPVYSVHVEAEFLSKQGIPMSKMYDGDLERKTSIEPLKPGETAMFEIAPFSNFNYDSYELSVTWSEIPAAE